MNSPDLNAPSRPGLSLGFMVLTVLVGAVVTAVLANVNSGMLPVYKDLGQQLPVITTWYLRFGTMVAAFVPVASFLGFAVAVMRNRPHHTVHVGIVSLALSGLIAAGGLHAHMAPIFRLLENL